MCKLQPLRLLWSQLSEPLKCLSGHSGLKLASPDVPWRPRGPQHLPTTFAGDQGSSLPALATSFRPNTLRIQLFPQLPSNPGSWAPASAPVRHTAVWSSGTSIRGPPAPLSRSKLSPLVMSRGHRIHHFPHSQLPNLWIILSLPTAPCSDVQPLRQPLSTPLLSPLFHSLVTQGEVTAPGPPSCPISAFPDKSN